MAKQHHEFRDPVHQFIVVNADERAVIDSEPVQRLREVHQLAMSYLVYPGATHRRFEHSLGVMELAGQVFDTITHSDNLTDQIREAVPQVADRDKLPYWRSVVRLAALCHDIGHLPFSHAAEHDMLPEGVTHETLTRELVLSEEIATILDGFAPPIKPEVLAKLAVGSEKASGESFNPWEGVLSEIIVGDAFGVDRMDYLLRDSHHAGVAYGRFDQHRLINTLRLLSEPRRDDAGEDADPNVSIGVEHGGLHAAEAMLLARYFMFSQVYFHPVRVVYDLHLIDFLKQWLPGGTYPGDLDQHLGMTDSHVLAAMRTAAGDPTAAGHDSARRIIRREHYRTLYDGDQTDLSLGLDPSGAVELWARRTWGHDQVLRRKATKPGGSTEFPVQTHGGEVAWSTALSETLARLPDARFDRVYIAPEQRNAAIKSLQRDKEKIIREHGQEEGEG